MEKWYWFWGKDQNNLDRHSRLKEFIDFNKMKIHSSNHSYLYSKKYKEYWSNYIKIVD